MKVLLILLLLVFAVTAQTRGELDSKYGPIEGNRYRIKPGIAVEVTFSESGKVRTFRIIPSDPNSKNALLRVDDVRKVVVELVPGRICRHPLKTTEIKLSCSPWKSCRGIEEEWKRATTLIVWYKDSVVYSMVRLKDEPIPRPGRMKLLSGYEHEPSCGIDTAGGYIRKIDGIKIHYDIGVMAGNFAMRYANSDIAEWTRTEKIGDDNVLIVLTKEKSIIATFEKAVANFSAKVSSQADIDDFLKMLLTYNPQ